MHTYTYALLNVSCATYKEIYTKLKEVGQLNERLQIDGEIDMAGLALVTKDEQEKEVK